MTEEQGITASEHSVAEQRAVAIYERISTLKIANDYDYLLMGELVKEVKAVVNKFEEETRPEIDQAHKLHKALIAKRDKWADKFAEAEALGKQKMKHFVETNEPPKIDGVSYAETWDGEVVNAELIPREYLIPDLKKLKELTKVLKEATVIPGWKVKSAKTISVRS